MAKTKRLLAIEDCAIVARMREGHAAPFPTDTGALVVSVPTANPALAVAALVPLLVRHLPLACATQLRAGADGEVQPLVDAEARQAWAQVDVYSETSAAGVELSRVTCGRNALHKVWANVLECEIVKIGGLNLRGLPAAANIEKEEELKALTELLRPIAERLEIGCVGSFARGSIGRSGTGAAALAEAGELEAAAEGEDDKQEVRRQKEAIEEKARGAATHPHRSCPPPRTRPILAPSRHYHPSRPPLHFLLCRRAQVKACRSTMMHNSNSSTWGDAEDQLLRDAISAPRTRYSDGKFAWNAIAVHVPGRSGPQCSACWYSVVDPTINKDEWSEAEIGRLDALVEKLGNKWTEIGTQLSGPSGRRTYDQTRNAYANRRRVPKNGKRPAGAAAAAPGAKRRTTYVLRGQ